MTTLNDAFINAVLADSAYVAGLLRGETGAALQVKLRDRMTGQLATYIGQNFSVVTQVESSALTGSSFDATVWKRNSDNAIFVSMRGTQQLTDFLVDADLTFSGGASGQLAAMINWWLRLTTANGDPALQIQRNPNVNDTGRYFLFAAPVIGTGLLTGANNIYVNGHSLGGHLATAFARIFGGSNSIGHVTTFNSAGFIGGSEAIFKNLRTMLGTSMASYPDKVLQTNYFSANGINFTTNTFWFNQIGQRVEVYNEEGTGVPNHYMYRLTDALALSDLLSALDSSLKMVDINKVFSAGANQSRATLESTLDAVRQVFLGNGISATLIGDIDEATPSRQSYHENLAVLRGAIAQGGYAGTLRIDTLPNSAKMLANAKDGGTAEVAYRYALKELNPFVLLGPSSVYAPHNTNGELDLYDATTGTGSLTETWLADRASFLSWKNQKNIKDVADDGFIQRTDFGAESFLFTDRTLKNSTNQDYSVRVLGGNNAQRTDPVQILFGSDASDTWTGSHYADHLYGEGGDDLLAGGDGGDYLEGGKGNDRLSGDDGNDILIGGAGNDTLQAGEGSNRLEGGVGFDTYEVVSGSLQLVVDTDGSGKILLDGTKLNGGTEISFNRFANDDETVTYTFVGDWVNGGVLEISGGVSIQGFHDGDLGIYLISEESEPSPRSPGRFVVTDDDNSNDINDHIEFSNAFDPTANGGHGDWIYDDVDTLPGVGNDVVTTAGSNVYVNGGQDNDFLAASPWVVQTNVTLAGGSGTDIIYGGLGDERIYGEEEVELDVAIASGESGEGSSALGDWLSGRGGDDILIGDAGKDVILGGAGNNTIVGGAGDDHIYGDEDASSALAYGMGGASSSVEIPSGFDFQWTFRQSSILRNDRYQEVPTNASDPFTPDGWGDNTIFAGNGDDWVSGGFGDDYIDGGNGNDILYGDDGRNVIVGGAGDDFIASGLYGAQSGGYIDGGDGHDRIVAVNGDYVIDAGAGDDDIEGDPFNPESGSYFIYAGEGNDTIRGSHGDDYVETGNGADTVRSMGGSDYVLGGEGDDYLESMEGIAELFGEDGNDVLSVVVSGTGTVLDGGLGDDEYDLFLLSGDVTVQDAIGDNRIVIMSVDQIEPEDGIAISSIQLDWTGTGLSIVYGNSGDRIRLAYDANLPSLYIRHITEQIDDRWIGEDELIALDSLTVRQLGSDATDFLEARTGWGNSIAGHAGNDFIIGADGNDTLSGGSGDDVLDGGAGGDLYLFSAGDGHDTISDSDTAPSNINLLRFGEGITTADLTVFQTYDDLLLNVGAEDAGDSVTIMGAASQDVIARVEFADGTMWDASVLRNIAVLVSAPLLELPVDPPPPTEESDAVESNPQPAAEIVGNADAQAVLGGSDFASVIFEPLLNNTPPPTVLENSFFTESFPTVSEPEPSGSSFGVFAAATDSFSNSGSDNTIGAGPVAASSIEMPSPIITESFPTVSEPEPSGSSFGAFAAATDSFLNSGSGNAIGAGPVAASSIEMPSPMAPVGGGVGGRGSSQTASTGDSRSDRADPMTISSRGAGASSYAPDSSNTEGSLSSVDESAQVPQTGQRESQPGGVSWLAQQAEAPRDTASALTNWAVANALLQFRLGGTEESAAGSSPVNFFNAPVSGLPGLSYLASLGLGAPGLGGDGAHLQSFSGLSEGLVALAA